MLSVRNHISTRIKFVKRSLLNKCYFKAEIQNYTIHNIVAHVYATLSLKAIKIHAFYTRARYAFYTRAEIENSNPIRTRQKDVTIL